MKKSICLSALAMVLLVSLLSASALASGAVDLNKATATEITAIEDAKIPADVAAALVKYREAHGPFKTGDELLKVPGMSNEIWQRLNPVETPDGKVVHDPDADAALAPSKC